MLRYNQALSIIKEVASAKKLNTESLSLEDSINRYVAEDCYSLDNNPRFDNSAMDGYALNSIDTINATTQNPVCLRKINTIAAGDDVSKINADTNTCVEIMTGAKIKNYDSVIRLEDVELLDDGDAICIKRPVKKGENVRYLGEDIKVGDLILRKGSKISPQSLLLLSMSGKIDLKLFSKPKLVLVATGSELVPCSSEKLGEMQIRNSTSPMLCSVLKEYGAEVDYLGIVRDEEEEIENLLLAALEKRPNIIVTTGGVSAGKYDYVRSVLEKIGAKIYFHKVAIRPGKPILFAEKDEAVFFSLPGNPIAVAAGLRFFVWPYLCQLFSKTPQEILSLPLLEKINKPEGLMFFQRGVRDKLGVKALSGQASFMTKSMIAADGWLVATEAGTSLESGKLVDWYSLW